VNDDASNQPERLALVEELSAEAKPSLEAADASATNNPQPAVEPATGSNAASEIPQKNSQEKQVGPAAAPEKGALYLDPAGDIVAVQPRCADIFARTRKELIGRNIQTLLKPECGQAIAELISQGRKAGEKSFQVLAIRKDGSEFSTLLEFKILPGFCWTVFVQAGNGEASPQKTMNVQVNSTSVPDRELQPIANTTETATVQPEVGDPSQAGSESDRMAAKLEAARAECERLSRIKFEADAAADKRLRKVQTEYGNRIMQLEQDIVAERQTNADLSKKIEALEQSLDEQTKGMRRIKQQLSEPEAMLDKTLTEIQELEQKYNALKSEATGLAQERERLQGELASSQTVQQKAQSQIAELMAKQEQTSRDLAELNKEFAAGKISEQKAEELNGQIEKLLHEVDLAELRARESAAKSKDWEKKAADFKKASDELNQARTHEQGESAQASQRLKELEQQLKRASDDLETSRTESEKQNSARQKLELENRSLTEANAKAKADADKERDGSNTLRQETEKLTAQLKRASDDLEASRTETEKQNAARQKLESENRSLTEVNAKAQADADKERDGNNTLRRETEKLSAQLQKLQLAAEQAETRARENAAHSKDWEKKAADLKKASEDLNKVRAGEQSASAQSAQRVKELEQQLKRASDDLAASRANFEKQNSARQKLEAENRSLSEANTSTKADLDKERETNNVSRQVAKKLNAQLESLQQAAQQAEARARESAGQSKDSEKKAADQKKATDELSQNLAAVQSALAKSAQRVKELEQQLKGANDNLTEGKAGLEKQSSARQKLEAENRNLTDSNAKSKADLDKERAAGKLSQQKVEELNAQVEKLRSAVEQAELRARESGAQSKDWEKKAADLKKAGEELNQVRINEQSASAQVAQRLKELEQQLKGANENLAASRVDLEKQSTARQRLETEIRSLTESNLKTKGEVEKERAANNTLWQETEKLTAQIQKLQQAGEQAEARARETAAQLKDWEKKATDQNKTIGELKQSHAAEQSAGIESAQRIKELEQQLNLKNDELSASKKEIEEQNLVRQQLETANRNLIGANAQAEAELEKTIGEFTQSLNAEQSASAKSAQRVKELEQQLKSANENLAASRSETEEQDSARQRLEKENRKLAEAGNKTQADLDEERDAHKLSRQAAQELCNELKKSQRAVEQAEARIRMSTDQYCDLEEKAVGLKKDNSLLEKELTERRRSIESLNKSLNELQQKLELGKSEREEMDDELARLREIEKHLQHEEYMMVDSLRRGLRQPIEDLRQSACGLLEGQLPDKQKRLAETILRHSLFLQVFLNASGKNAGEKFPS